MAANESNDRRYRLQASNIDFEFRPTGGPIDDLTGTGPLFELLGRASAAWARMELMLDIILLHINKSSESAVTLRHLKQTDCQIGRHAVKALPFKIVDEAGHFIQASRCHALWENDASIFHRLARFHLR